MSGATKNDVHNKGKTTAYPEKVSSYPVQTPLLLRNPFLTKETLLKTERLRIMRSCVFLGHPATGRGDPRGSG
jgi:hypothetical protein